MNLLIDELPTSVFIDGVSYEINTDYRIGIMFETMMLDSEISDADKLKKAINLFFGHNIPDDLSAAVDKIMWFYDCGKRKDNGSRRRRRKVEKKRVYDYDYDDAYIYAAFLQQYGVDLQDEFLHWWKFKAMFRSLSDNTEFVKIMGYRSIKITPSMTKSQREFYKEMQDIHALPLPQNEVDKKRAIEEALLNGGDVASILSGGG